jgi:hypothetical protein
MTYSHSVRIPRLAPDPQTRARSETFDWRVLVPCCARRDPHPHAPRGAGCVTQPTKARTRQSTRNPLGSDGGTCDD